MAEDYTFLHQLPDVPLPFVKPTGNLLNKWDMKMAKTKAFGYGAVNRIQFDTNNQMLVTFNKRVMVLNQDPKAIIAASTERIVADYKDSPPYSATLRSDGRLAAIGGEQPLIKLFNVETRNILRTFRGHTGPVHVVRFIGKDRIISGSNDQTIRIWDIDTGEETQLVGRHTDQIRALVGHPINNNLWLSGGYDHKVKLWDIDNNTCVHTLDHGAPVEDLIILKSGSMAVSCGGNYIRVWDLLAGTMAFQSSNHAKTITSLYLNDKGTKFLSAGLDQIVKVYSSTNYGIISTIKFGEPILTMTMNNKKLYVGTTLGSIQVAKKKIQTKRVAKRDSKNNVSKTTLTDVAALNRFKCSNVDKLLKKFEHKAAFDAVLLIEKSKDVFFKVVCELSRREALDGVMMGRDTEGLTALLEMILKLVQTTKYTSCGVMLMDRVLDLYKETLLKEKDTANLFFKIKSVAKKELYKQRSVLRVAGALELLYSNQTENTSTIQSAMATDAAESTLPLPINSSSNKRDREENGDSEESSSEEEASKPTKKSNNKKKESSEEESQSEEERETKKTAKKKKSSK
ncbi:hypothetical protein SAMD00019534_003900 [Acytostelium subglobosum LB1]|uniref:hypothetical protein n=1 Tax=Acytostelium subglobosum LB1 TaxID=1410327 RepID=UPI000644FE92|nr:hypothetical protein SAMD00019534_003900 [Acytostelium subglobosum LB1]GAM17215.1 hypothetical protein SAMD00019534_003900 [Acytostelium subglobosum LB1]|eukprot:XP_012759277.1 hypothetical protein SAMD00019534_003900 [Acytostelium subglobosum LB1]